jgi:hypothetical protein
VPNRRRLGHLDVVCVIVLACFSRKREEKRGQLGLGKGPKMWQLTLSMGPARAEICSYKQRATIPSKQVAHTLNTYKYHTCKKKLITCVLFI